MKEGFNWHAEVKLSDGRTILGERGYATEAEIYTALDIIWNDPELERVEISGVTVEPLDIRSARAVYVPPSPK